MRFMMKNLRLTKLEEQEPVSKCDHLSVPQLRVGRSSRAGKCNPRGESSVSHQARNEGRGSRGQQGVTSAAGRHHKYQLEENLMYAAIRQATAKAGSAEELARRIKEGAIPIISDVEGFMAYYVVYAGDDTVTAISIFNKYEQAEEANRRALAWIAENVEPLLVGDAKAVAGPVIVHTRA